MLCIMFFWEVLCVIKISGKAEATTCGCSLTRSL